jgi:hypothetical protein
VGRPTPLFLHAFYFWRLTLLPLNLKRTLLKLLKKANSYFRSGTRDGLIPKIAPLYKYINTSSVRRGEREKERVTA